MCLCACEYSTLKLNSESKAKRTKNNTKHTSKNFYIKRAEAIKTRGKMPSERARKDKVKNGQRNEKPVRADRSLGLFLQCSHEERQRKKTFAFCVCVCVCSFVFVVLFSLRFGVSSSRSLHDLVRYLFRRCRRRRRCST